MSQPHLPHYLQQRQPPSTHHCLRNCQQVTIALVTWCIALLTIIFMIIQKTTIDRNGFIVSFGVIKTLKLARY